MSRLLLVEDNEESRDGLSRHLRRKRYAVLTAADGRPRPEAARDAPPDLVSMDLTLLLSPVVSRLERRGLKRFPAVLSVAVLAFVLIALAGWAVAAQVTSLLADLPQHRASIRAKLAQFRHSGKPGPLGSLQKFLD